VAPYYYYPAWWEGAANTHLFVNLDKWKELPKSYQAAIRAATGEATSWMVARYDTRNAAALRRLIAGGTQLRPFPREVMDACHAEELKLEQELSAQNADFRRIHEEWSKSRDDMRAWFAVAEQGFDNYLTSAARRR
jgi:TRAP-type mannitol/chloroaromatic compound transport system substrate-binding protein